MVWIAELGLVKNSDNLTIRQTNRTQIDGQDNPDRNDNIIYDRQANLERKDNMMDFPDPLGKGFTYLYKKKDEHPITSEV